MGNKSCSNCGNCIAWDDQGNGIGEYICSIPDEELPECDVNGDCPAWVSDAVYVPHRILLSLRKDVSLSVLMDISKIAEISEVRDDLGTLNFIFLANKMNCTELMDIFGWAICSIVDLDAREKGISYTAHEVIQ